MIRTTPDFGVAVAQREWLGRSVPPHHPPALALGEHLVVEFTEHLGLAQSTVSGHVACLRERGLVTAWAKER